MNTEAKIAAAIEKLEGLQYESVPGPWVARDADPQMDGRNWQIRTEGVAGIRIAAHDYGHYLNVELIVTLHRTIDALLGLLRVAVNNPGCETDEEVALANAILGEHT